MPQSKLFRFGYGVLLLFLIIWIGTKINFMFRPLVVLIQTLFSPFLVAGVLYYLFRPLVNYLEKKNVKRPLAILLLYAAAGGLLILFVVWLGPVLQKQVQSFIQNAPALVEAARVKFTELQENELIRRFLQDNTPQLEGAANQVFQYISSSLSHVGTNVANVVGVITSIVTVFVTVPFILFYMLKEGEKAPQQILRLLPSAQQQNGWRVLNDLDAALSSYIQGQIFVSICVGVMLYMGYLIIGIQYSLVLAIVAMFTNVIPFLGPIIAIIPALVVAILQSPAMIVKVLIVMVIAQQVEGNIISPQVMGRSLAIHPLTIISILLVAGSLGGVFGLILAVPVYAVLKVIVQNAYRLWKLRQD
ncbi:AI-2E family transporter [Ectobacillus ponti]|uniref:AI-2E family transporter n=1 Tax=Ectobacillus ponti TaxID=2961894 RepID=A0AA42BPR4_9BACI|nr:AI-2E family transporter [Ectobacillus ponti]MCP8969430.1 AI-2E family transporter [Ectobacillus ponti]